MRRRLTVHRLAPGHAPSNRLAWWAAFLTTVALIVLLNVVRADAAAPPVGPSFPVFADLEPEEEPAEEEEEEEETEGQLGERECEAGEVAACSGEAEEDRPPRECRLAATSAMVAAYPHGRRVVLIVRYTARVATRVEISYRLRGTRGGLRMAGDRARFAGTGSLRDARTATPAQMTRVLGAKSFSVEIRPLGAPAYCQAYFDHRLSVKRTTARGAVWIE
jgi:hypothetical protein